MAVFLNSFLPGLGQIYSGARPRGLLWIAISCVLLYMISSKGFALIYHPEVKIEVRNLLTLLLLLLLTPLIYIGSLIDGYQTAKKHNSDEDLRILKERKKSPWLSVTLSRFIPGLGQLYNRQLIRAILYIAGWVFINWLFQNSWLILTGAPLVVLSMVDAYGTARRINDPADKTGLRISPLPALLICLCIIITYLPYTILAKDLLFQTYRVRGGAMKPCLLPNDRVIIDKILFRFTGINRGDVFAFKCPDRPGLFYIKRIVGLPGEEIEIKDGKVLIDGQRLQTGTVIDKIGYLNYGPYGQPGLPVPLPNNSYYFLGDRLKKSLDSRFYGPIPLEEIVGKTVKIYRPLHRAGPVK